MITNAINVVIIILITATATKVIHHQKEISEKITFLCKIYVGIHRVAFSQFLFPSQTAN